MDAEWSPEQETARRAWFDSLKKGDRVVAWSDRDAGGTQHLTRVVGRTADGSVLVERYGGHLGKTVEVTYPETILQDGKWFRRYRDPDAIRAIRPPEPGEVEEMFLARLRPVLELARVLVADVSSLDGWEGFALRAQVSAAERTVEALELRAAFIETEKAKA